MGTRTITITTLIVLTALSRLIPHLPNFTPIVSMALFGGAYYTRKRMVYLAPLLAMLISDIGLHLLHGYALFTPMRLVIYGTLALIAAGGTRILQGKIRLLRVGFTGLAGAVIFYLTTNLAVWLQGTLYPMTLNGLVECYVAAIPFFRNTLMGTLSYAAVLFGVFEWARLRFPMLART